MILGKGDVITRDDAVVASGLARRRRSRRGGRAHRRPRSRAVDAAAASRRRRARRADRAAEARPPRAPHARCARPRRGDHVVVHSGRRSQVLRRRGAGARARQSDFGRDVVDAARPAAGPADGAEAQPQSRLRRRGAVRARPGLSRRASRTISTSRPPACARGTAKLGGSGRHWDGAAKDVDLFDAKADAFAVLAALGFDPAKAQITRDAPAWYHPGRSGTLRLGPKTVLAHFGEVHPATLKALDVPAPVAAFEVFLDALAGAKDEEPRQAAPRGRRPAARAPRLRLRARSRRCRPAMSCAPPPAPTRR